MCQLITDNIYGATNQYLFVKHANFKETEFQYVRKFTVFVTVSLS